MKIFLSPSKSNVNLNYYRNRYNRLQITNIFLVSHVHHSDKSMVDGEREEAIPFYYTPHNFKGSGSQRALCLLVYSRLSGYGYLLQFFMFTKTRITYFHCC